MSQIDPKSLWGFDSGMKKYPAHSDSYVANMINPGFFLPNLLKCTQKFSGKISLKIKIQKFLEKIF